MELHVVIIGGGIGGLCLAQGLLKAGVSVAVYEKGSDRYPQSSWLQGYQIHINGDGSRALQDCLPQTSYDSFSARALLPSSGVQLLTEQLEQLKFVQRDNIFHGSNPIVRSDLRRVLLEGLDDYNVVHFGKQFVKYERATTTGQVQAKFKDGSTALGDVLVGADGTGSKVRSQYLPHAKITDTGLVGMAGRLPITEMTKSHLPEHLLTRLTGMLTSKGMYMIVTQSIHKQEHQAPLEKNRLSIASSSSSTTMTTADDIASDESDHLIWVLVSSHATYGGNQKLLFRDGPALQKLALQLMQTWHPDLFWMVKKTDPNTISATALRSSEPIGPWETSNITLLGDAIHTMPPLRGLGGSTALRDAALLCRKLLEVKRGNTPLIPAIHEYEAEMINYGFDAVRMSMQMVDMITNNNSTSAFLQDHFVPQDQAASRSPSSLP